MNMHIYEMSESNIRERISKKLNFIPTINYIDNKYYLEVNEEEFIEMTMPFFKDYYTKLTECFYIVSENLRRTSIKNLECRAWNKAGMPDTLDLPSMDFDPFLWRFILPDKFSELVQKNDFIFDSEIGNFKILKKDSDTVYANKIETVRYLITTI